MIGCDFHPSFQQVAIFDNRTGEIEEKRLQHRGEAEQFYGALAGGEVRVGMEACGHYPWCERLPEELGIVLARMECSRGHDPSRRNHQIMTRRRMFTLLVVVAHWIVAVGHLFLAAKVLPAPNNSVSWLAITLITLGHLGVSIALWKLSDKLSGLVSLIFFFAALSADLYEHFLQASANNVFMVASGDWTARFDVSVFVLLALEIVGCLLGILLLGRGTRNDSQPKFARS